MGLKNKVENYKKLWRVLSGKHCLKQKLNLLNAVMNKQRQILSYFPVNLSIVSTNNCNLSCSMCPTHSEFIPDTYEWGQNCANDMTLSNFKKVLDIFPHALKVGIVGSGEPLLNRDLFEMIEYAASNRRMNVSTISNGMILQKYLDEIVTSPLQYISISLNGYNPEEYHRLTNNDPENFNLIYHNIQKLVNLRNALRSKLKIFISFIIDRYNWMQIPEFINVAESLKVDHINLINFLPSPFEGYSAEERCLFVQDENIVSFLKKAVPDRMKDSVSLPVLLDLNSTRKRCQCHFQDLRVDGDFNFSSCSTMLLNMKKYGVNMGEECRFSEHDVWNSPFFQDMRRRFLSPAKSDLFEPCKVCWVNYGSQVI